MTADHSQEARSHEPTMCSLVGLPTPGSVVTLLITRVHLHPLCVLVEFWGKFSLERAAEYKSLAKDIQSPGNAFQVLEGSPGDQCLVQVDGKWFRSRIVSRIGSICSLFLFDEGRTHSTSTSKLAWGRKKHFQLPPEVEFCLLTNVLPVSPENRWSPMAFEFLKSLSGRSVKAYVQDVLVLHRTFLLCVPSISRQMYEMGIARKLTPDLFQDFVLMSLQSHSGAQATPETWVSLGAGERLHNEDLFLYPELPAGTVEIVVVTEVTNPQRIFCQLKVFSQELKKLSGQITQCCEGRTTSCTITPEMIGFPCAARGSDGMWHRSVLQQVSSISGLVEVLNVDSGTKQFVQVENVRQLAAEFFRMPVVTYICSLHGVSDRGVGWTSNQIDYLRTVLLHKTLIAKFEYQSVSEGVHYVTLCREEGTSINNLFGSKENRFVESDATFGNYSIGRASSHSKPSIQPGGPGRRSEEEQKIPAEDLAVGSSQLAVVQHIFDPSEFWIQTQTWSNELDELMDGIYHLFKDSGDKAVVRNPTVGLYCAARVEDGDFYRATVAEVGENRIKVFLVDYGNMELVDRRDIQNLPGEFTKLPHLALRCRLDGISPKGGNWSQSACDFFTKAIKDKEVTVTVTARCEEGYVVQITYPGPQGQTNLSTLMCSSGFAERDESKRQTKIRPQIPETRLSGVFRTLTPGGLACNQRSPMFKEHMFPIGSVLDVCVSFMGSPNDFWCQLVHNAGHLKLLMRDLQTHYADSHFQPLMEVACVARHPDNRMWYRALVIHRHEMPNVDVLFVDYGQADTVSIYDLRRISPKFLALQGQAFRCSLLNPIDPMSANNEWNEDATAKFHSFVETAASSYMILKCTIYAVMYSEQKIMFNVVDLETPFESVCTSMANMVQCDPPKRAPGPSFCLDTYYYSKHGIKTGTEEQVKVTCVNNIHEFYCHLERNADTIKSLNVKVNKLCLKLEKVKLPTVFGTLCFAKYTDGLWYRGQIKATKPAILVHFVDYGDTIKVRKHDLLPVPREASDIMAVPVQALVCSLCDVPADVPSKMNCWFQTSTTEFTFRALVVAREADGKLQVELYQGNTQVNSKMKKMFQVGMHTEEKVSHQNAPEVSLNQTVKTPKVLPTQITGTEDQLTSKNVSKPAQRTRNKDTTRPATLKSLSHACEGGRKTRSAPLKLYVPPHQRQPSRTPSQTGDGSKMAGGDIQPTMKSTSLGAGSEARSPPPPLMIPKISDLPSPSVTADMEADVYVSHCNSPLSFYVQLFRDMDGLSTLAEKLNDPQSSPQTNHLKDLHPGDLVQAEFADDSLWYRAVVRELLREKMTALVEFVDFGNTAVVPLSKMARLQKAFVQLPVYSIHCRLSQAFSLGEGMVLDPGVMSTFREDVCGGGEKVLRCRFIRWSGCVWDVCLEDGGVKVACEVAATSSPGITSVEPEQTKVQPAQNQLENPLHYLHRELLEGQRLEVYVTAINTQTFWCQPVDSEGLAQVTTTVSAEMDATGHRPVHPDSLCPGSPCVALFSEDGFWYRAEVLDRHGDELSVLFVDYGTESRVSVANVRRISSELLETPSQAFLCELDGFVASQGSWLSGAVDQLTALTADRVMQLTVASVSREGGKLRCSVRLDCDGRVINEELKTWWRNSSTENHQTTSHAAHLQDPPGPSPDPLRDHMEDQGPGEILLHDGDQPSSPPLPEDQRVLDSDEGAEEEGPDDITCPDSEDQRGDAEVSMTTSAVKLVLREHLQSKLRVHPPETLNQSEDWIQVHTESVQSCCELPEFDGPLDQDQDSGAVPEEDLPGAGPQVERDSWTGEDPLHQDPRALPCGSDPAAGPVLQPDLSEPEEEEEILTTGPPEEESELVEMEPPALITRPDQVRDEDSCDGLSFEAQLLKVTHLCLMVQRGSGE